MKEEELKTIEVQAQRAGAGAFDIGTGEASALCRDQIVAGMRKSVEAWEQDIDAPMHIATLGGLVIRISHEAVGAEADAERVAEFLMALTASRRSAVRLVAEVRRLRAACDKALCHLVADEGIETERILREVSQ